ncbi:MAG: fibronectin type III domain-containing protein [Elusimicrobiota bacterium]
MRGIETKAGIKGVPFYRLLVTAIAAALPALPCAAAPAPDFFTVSVQKTEIRWGWEYDDPAAVGFRIFGASSPEGPFSLIAGAEILGPHATTYTETGLTPGSEYFRYIAAVSGGGLMRGSIGLQVQTPGPGQGSEKVWSGRGRSGNASEGANWLGGMVPSDQEAVRFDATNSTKSCRWDLDRSILSSLAIKPGYGAAVTLAIPDLTIERGLLLESGVLSFNRAHVTVGGGWRQTAGTFMAGQSTVTLDTSIVSEPLDVTAASPFHHLVIGAGERWAVESEVNFLSPLIVTGNLTNRASRAGRFSGGPAVILGDMRLYGEGADWATGRYPLTVKGTLRLRGDDLEVSSTLRLGTGVHIEAGGGEFVLTNGAVITSLAPGQRFYSFIVEEGGYLRLLHGSILSLDSGGIQVRGPMYWFSHIANITFDMVEPGATALNFLYETWSEQRVFDNLTFADPGIGTNIAAPRWKGGAQIIVIGFDGVRGGPSFENDPHDSITWVGGTRRVWAAETPGRASDGGNWSPAGTLQNDDEVVFDGSGGGDCDWDVEGISLSAIALEPDFTGTVSLAVSEMTVLESLTLAGGRLSFNDAHVTLAGDWTQTGGVFEAGRSTVTMDTALLGEDLSVMAHDPFHHLVIGAGGQWIDERAVTFLSPLTVSGDLTGGGGRAANLLGGPTVIHGDMRLQGGGAVWRTGPHSLEIGGTLRLEGSDIEVDSTLRLGTGVHLEGSGEFALINGSVITSIAPGESFYSFIVDEGASLRLARGAILSLDSGGIQMRGPMHPLSYIGNITFDSLQPGATALNFLYEATSEQRAFDNLTFADPGIGTNVAAPGWSESAQVIVSGFDGARGGPAFELDPHDVIVWIADDGKIAALPEALEDLAAAALDASSIRWTWQAAGSALSYDVFSAIDASAPLATVTGASFTRTGLSTNTAFGIMVRGVNEWGAGRIGALTTAYTLAERPDGLEITAASSDTISLSWSRASNPEGTVFELRRSVGEGFVPVLRGTATSVRQTGLRPLTEYAFMVGARNGDSVPTAFTAEASTMTLPPAPGEPAVSGGTALGVSSISWTWSRLPHASRYNVFRASDTSEALATTDSTAFVWTGLSVNADYGIVVQGLNEIGGGPLSGPSTAHTLAERPDSLEVTAASSATISLAWPATANPAGTLFELQRSVGEGFVTVLSGTATAAEQTGLRPGTPYIFRLRARNGDSRWTEYGAVASTTTLQLPPDGSAVPVGAALGESSISWTWAPLPRVSRYDVFRASDTSEPLVSTVSTGFAWGGLAPNTPYGVVVRGINATGEGPLSKASTAYTLAERPDGLEITAVSSAAVSLAWSAAGNPPGTVFELQRSVGEGFVTVLSGTAAAAAQTGLRPAAAYAFRVRALNGDQVPTGFGAEASATTLPPLPDRVGTPVAVALGVSSIAWTWGALPHAERYEVYCASSPSAPLGSVAAASHTLTGLSVNAAYGIVVKGLNETGEGLLSEPSTAHTLAARPAGLVITAVSSTSIALGWSADGNPEGTVYEVWRDTGAGFAVAAATTRTDFAVPGLAPTGVVAHKVRAFNHDSVPTSFSATVSTMTLPPLPGRPQTPSGVALGVSAIAWTWAALPHAAGYDIYSASSLSTLLASVRSASFARAGLSVNAAYGIVVQAVNASGRGPLSGPATVHTQAARPDGLRITAVSSTSVTLSWSAGANPAPTLYEVHRDTGTGFLAIGSTTLPRFADAGLAPESASAYQVRALNGDSKPTAFSSAVSTTTLPPALGAPRTPAGDALGVSSIAWTWAALPHAAAYRVYAASDTSEPLASVSSAGFTWTGLPANAGRAILVQGVNEAGAGPLSGTASAHTLAARPAALAIAAVSPAGLSLVWSANGNPEGTLYEVHRDAGAGFAAVAATTLTGFLDAEAAPAGAVRYRVRALNGASIPTGFTATLSTSDLPPLPGRPGPPAGAVLSTTSVLWTWSATASADGYRIFLAGSTGTWLGSSAVGGFTQNGLSPNTPSSVVVEGFNTLGTGPRSEPSSVVYTLANPPAGTAASSVRVTSAKIDWGINGNPAATTAQLERSPDGASFTSVFTGFATAFTDSGLSGCSTYYYRARNVNAAGVATAYDATILLKTEAAVPLGAGNLEATPLEGNRVALSWAPSPSEGVIEYRLYFDAGTGVIDYDTPLAVLSSTETAYTTDVLVSSPAYRFGLRAYNSCGVEEGNTSVLASAPALNSLTGVQAAIKEPKSGKRLKGNSVTIVAELFLGDEAQTRRILFQYKPSADTAWSDITAADVSHPNPDPSGPFFVHWNADAVTPGAYDLRAVASDIQGELDACPPSITVIVDPVDFDISETSLGGGKVRKEQKVNNAVTNEVKAADEGTSQVTTLSIPAGALNASTVTVSVVNNPTDAPAPPEDVEAVSVVTEITLSNAQRGLSNGKSAAVTLSFPDQDGDGIVDGTTVRAEQLRMFSSESPAGPWKRDLSCSVDLSKRTVTGMTRHFSFFALFAPAASSLSAVRAYPVPFMPNSGDPDDGAPYSPGDPDSGIIFDNLPASVEIKVYTLTGQLVAGFGSGSSGNKLRWDVRNDGGEDVASGLYFAVISGSGESPVVKKLLIVR